MVKEGKKKAAGKEAYGDSSLEQMKKKKSVTACRRLPQEEETKAVVAAGRRRGPKWPDLGAFYHHDSQKRAESGHIGQGRQEVGDRKGKGREKRAEPVKRSRKHFSCLLLLLS